MTGGDDFVKADDVDELRSAVVILAARVTSLSDALVAVNEIQQRQAATERKTEQIQKEANQAKQDAVDLASSVVTKTNLAQVTAVQDKKTLEFRKNTLVRVYSTGLILVLFLLAGVGGLVSYQADKSRSAQSICHARNEQNRIIISILEGSIKGADPNQPRVQNILNGITQFKNLQQDCGKL